MKKRLLSWLLCTIMVISILPAPAWAEGEDPATPAGTEQIQEQITQPTSQSATEAETKLVTETTTEAVAEEVATDAGASPSDDESDTNAPAFYFDRERNGELRGEKLTERDMNPGGSQTLFFYLNGVMLTEEQVKIGKNLTCSENLSLSKSDSDIENGIDVQALSCGEGYIQYTTEEDGVKKSHRVTIYVTLPEYGFYKAATVSEANYLDDSFIFDADSTALYLMADENSKDITGVDFLDDQGPVIGGHEFLSLEKVNLRSWKVTLKTDGQLPDPGYERQQFRVYFTNEAGEADHSDLGINIKVIDNVGLTLCECEEDDDGTVNVKDPTRQLNTITGRNHFFYLYENGKQINAGDKLNEIILSDSKAVTLSAQTTGLLAGAFCVKAETPGSASITFGSESVTISVYDMKYGFYEAASGGKPLDELVFDTPERVFYILPQSSGCAPIKKVELAADAGNQFKLTQISDGWQIALKSGGQLDEPIRLEVRIFTTIGWNTKVRADAWTPMVSLYRTLKNGGPDEPLVDAFKKGNAEADRTFYVFGLGGTLFADSARLASAMDEDVPVYIETIRDEGGIYFKVVLGHYRENEREYEFILWNGDKPNRFVVDIEQPKLVGKVEVSLDGQNYYLGLMSAHRTTKLNEGMSVSFYSGTYMDMPPDDPPTIYCVPIIAEEMQDPVSGELDYYYRKNLSDQLNVLSAQLFSYVDDEWTCVDDTSENWYASKIQEDHFISTTARENNDEDSTHYLVVKVKLDGEIYTFCTRIFLDYYTIDSIDLRKDDVRARYDTLTKDEKIDLDELHKMIDQVTQETDVTRLTIILPDDNPLEGTLTISCKQTLILEGNNNTLVGSIRSESVADNDWHEIYDLHCVSPTYNAGKGSRSGIGFSGHGEVFPRNCSFTGYEIGLLWAADFNDKVNGEIPRRLMSAAVMDCEIGLLYDAQSCKGGLGNTFNDMTFYGNKIAIQVKSQDDIRRASHVLNISSSCFVDNKIDLVNDSHHVVKMAFNYFGAYTGEISGDDAREVMIQQDLVAKLAPRVPRVGGWVFTVPQAMYAEKGTMYRLHTARESYGLYGTADTVSNMDIADAETVLNVDENYAGKLNIQQAVEDKEGLQYENVATWDFSKEDKAQ